MVAPRTGRNSRWPQPAKHPRRARHEIHARRNGRNTRPPQRAKSPVVHSAIRRWRNPRGRLRRPQSRRPHPSRGGGRRLFRFPRPVPHFIRCSYHRMHPVGADAHIGPHAAPSTIAHHAGAHPIDFASMRRSMPPGTAGTMWASSPTNKDGLPRMVCGAGTLSDTVRYKAAAHHPVRGGDGGSGAVGDGPGDCAICGWRFETMGDFAPCAARVFRWLRPAGVSPAAAGDQRRCLWTPRFFEKNRVKLLYLGA